MSALYQHQGFLDIEALRIDGKAVSARGNACHGKGDAVVLFKHGLLADQQACQCARYIPKSHKSQFVLHVLSYTGG